MCLRVFANGDASSQGTRLSVFVCLMRGEFDDHHKWPFRGNISIRLVNQEEDKDHTVKIVKFTESVPQIYCQRVTKDEPSPGHTWVSPILTPRAPHYSPNI